MARPNTRERLDSLIPRCPLLKEIPWPGLGNKTVLTVSNTLMAYLYLPTDGRHVTNNLTTPGDQEPVTTSHPQHPAVRLSKDHPQQPDGRIRAKRPQWQSGKSGGRGTLLWGLFGGYRVMKWCLYFPAPVHTFLYEKGFTCPNLRSSPPPHTLQPQTTITFFRISLFAGVKKKSLGENQNSGQHFYQTFRAELCTIRPSSSHFSF